MYRFFASFQWLNFELTLASVTFSANHLALKSWDVYLQFCRQGQNAAIFSSVNLVVGFFLCPPLFLPAVDVWFASVGQFSAADCEKAHWGSCDRISPVLTCPEIDKIPMIGSPAICLYQLAFIFTRCYIYVYTGIIHIYRSVIKVTHKMTCMFIVSLTHELIQLTNIVVLLGADLIVQISLSMRTM